MATNPDFQKILGFTADDLATNRRGQLTEAQINVRKKVEHSSALGRLGIQVFFFIFAVILLLILGNVGLVGPAPSDGSVIWGLFSVAISGLALLVLGVFMAIAAKAVLFPPTPTLNRITGTIVRGNPSRRKGMYEIGINERSFEIPQAAYDLIEAAEIYTVYTADIAYTRLPIYNRPDNDKIIAMEAVDFDESAGPKSPLDYQNERLRYIFNFTEADLANNRAGKLSPEQLTRLTTQGSGRYIKGALFQVFIFVLIPSFSSFVMIGSPILLVIGLSGLLLIFLLLIRGDVGSRQTRSAKSLASGVRVAKGTAKPRIIRRESSVSRQNPTEINYQVHISHKPFEVSEAVYYAFKEGRSYAVYYIPKTSPSVIVSAEEIG